MYQQVARPKALVVEHIDPQVRERVGAGGWFYDFGRAAFGTVALDVACDDTQGLLEVHLGERLSAPGEIDRQPPGCVRYRRIELRVSRGHGVHRVEIPPDARNTGPQAIRMPADLFEVLPFRYAEVRVLQGNVRVLGVQQLAVHYPFDEAAAQFTCADERLNRVWELCKYSIKATSFCGVYVDGDRERIPYEGDAYLNQLCHYGVDREYGLARHTLEYLLFHPTWPTEWQLHCVPMAWEDYLYTGDRALLETYYDELRAKMLLPLAREDGLISTSTGLVTPEVLASIHLQGELGDLVDWPPGSFTAGGTGERDNHEMLPINTVVNAFHCWNLALFSRIAGVLGRTEDAQAFAAHAARVTARLQELLFDRAAGCFVDGEGSAHASQHASLFPAAMGLTPRGEEARVGDFLVGKGMACSVYGAQYLLDALYTLGRPEAALRLMTAEHDRGWLNMLAAGSTVTLEAWDWKYKNNLDWNHAWGAAPANIIPRRLVGVRPLAPGGATCLLAPQPADLPCFTAQIPLRDGAVNVHFEQTAGKATLRFRAEGPQRLELDLACILPTATDVRLDGKAIEYGRVVLTDLAGEHEVCLSGRKN